MRRGRIRSGIGCAVALAFGALMVHDILFDQVRFAIIAVADVVLGLVFAVAYVVVQNRRGRPS